MHDFEGYQRRIYEGYKWLANGSIKVLQMAPKREGKQLQLALDHRSLLYQPVLIVPTLLIDANSMASRAWEHSTPLPYRRGRESLYSVKGSPVRGADAPDSRCGNPNSSRKSESRQCGSAYQASQGDVEDRLAKI